MIARLDLIQGGAGARTKRFARETACGPFGIFADPEVNEKVARKRPLPGNVSAFAAVAGNQLGSAMWRCVAIGAKRPRIHQILDSPASGFEHWIHYFEE